MDKQNTARKISSRDVSGVASTSLERALVILDLISRTRRGLTQAEIARSVGLASSSCTYVLSRLERFGYCARDWNTRRYRLGIKVVALAHGVLRDLGLRRAEPILHNLVARFNSSAIAAVLERGQVMIVDKVETPELVRIDYDIGAKLSPHGSGLGKVLWASLPDAYLSKLISRYGLPRLTPKTITSESELRAELRRVREQGYAVSDGELFAGVYSVAAPIYNPSGSVIASLCIVGSRRSLISEDTVSAVKAAANAISNRLSEGARDYV